MPREHFGPGYAHVPRSELLSFEEIAHLAGLLKGLGLRKVRLTGGEPLLRRELPRLVRLLKSHELEVAMTTNAALLPRHARDLRQAGLDRITVSLDALDPSVFQAITDTDVQPEHVLAGIRAAERAGFERLRINCVVKRSLNEQEIPRLVRHFRGSGHVLRFIEFMDVGSTNGWLPDAVVSESEILEHVSREAAFESLPRLRASDTASRYRLRDGSLELGVVASVTRPFCGDCVRARVSARGELFTCLFGAPRLDVRALLRGGSDLALLDALTGAWRARSDRYSELRGQAGAGIVTLGQLLRVTRPEMSHVGG
jgi:cyclic pyranopterin phosphate synthase